MTPIYWNVFGFGSYDPMAVCPRNPTVLHRLLPVAISSLGESSPTAGQDGVRQALDCKWLEIPITIPCDVLAHKRNKLIREVGTHTSKTSRIET